MDRRDQPKCFNRSEKVLSHAKHTPVAGNFLKDRSLYSPKNTDLNVIL